MNNIITLLGEILKEIEKYNPFDLIGKGGTILSIYHLNHRDSQDLDFDCISKNKDKDFNSYFRTIFDRVVKAYKNKISYKIDKEGTFSTTGRYHMKLTFSSYKPLPPTKMEINFIDKMPKDLVSMGKFKFYPLENLFFQKLRASSNRAEIKDIIDVGLALKSKSPSMDSNQLKKYNGLSNLIKEAISRLEELEKNPKEWKEEFANTKLKFKVNEKTFPSFMRKTKLELYKLRKVL